MTFWSDNFDADLLKVIPETEEILGETANIQLWTHGGLTDGKLNHPSCWNTDVGMTAFFGFKQTGFKPDAFWTDRPLVSCTFLEACRDAWVHGFVIGVDGYEVADFCSTQGILLELMHDLRGIHKLQESKLISRKASIRRLLNFAALTIQATHDLFRYHNPKSEVANGCSD